MEGDFLQRNGTIILTLVGLFMACVGSVLAFMLKSRCTKIRCGCLSCERDVLPMTVADAKLPPIRVSEVQSVLGT